MRITQSRIRRIIREEVDLLTRSLRESRVRHFDMMPKPLTDTELSHYSDGGARMTPTEIVVESIINTLGVEGARKLYIDMHMGVPGAADIFWDYVTEFSEGEGEVNDEAVLALLAHALMMKNMRRF